MEPAITPILTAAITKFVASTSSELVKNALENKVARRRMASQISEKSAQAGVTITPNALRQWLERDDVERLLLTADMAACSSAIRALAHVIEGRDVDRMAQAQRIMEVVLNEYLRLQNPRDAAVIASARTRYDISADGDHTREEVSSLRTSVDESLSRADEAGFAESLSKLAPFHATRAAELVDEWSLIRRLLRSFVRQEDRGAALTQWSKNAPDYWSDAPAEVWCWLGELSADYGQPVTAEQYMRLGISKGALPSDYWWARITLLADGTPEAVLAFIQQIITESRTTHPLATAHLRFMQRQFDEAESVINAWSPTSPRDNVLKLSILEACATQKEDSNRAISLALQGVDLGGTGMSMRAAHLLLFRSIHGISDNRMNDAVQAYQLALSVRDQRRRWRGDSVEAILMAVVAAMAYTDSDGAWKLLQPAPMGDALEYETVDPRLRRERAVLAASTGRPTEALELAEALNDPYVSALVRGWQALRSSDEAVACAEWHLAFEAAPSDSEKLQVAKALAALGKSMPDLHNLAEQHPAAIKTINVIYKALSRPGDRLVILRAEAHKSVELSSLLGETLVEKGDLSGAAKVYRDAAYRWTFPIFLSMAGSLHFRSKNYAEAAKATTQALTMAGPGWSGELSTQITRFDTLVADGKLQEAIDVARRLIVLAPDDDGIRWSLVGALLQNGEVEGAWSALNYNGVSIDPRNQNEALVWINLGSPRDKSKGFLRKALEVIRDKINDPEAVGGALLHLQLGLGEPGRTLPQQDLEEFRAVSDKYVRDYPNSKTYRMISGGDDENPLAAISKVVQERSNQTKGLEGILTQAHNGALPLGFLTDIQRQPYIEGAIYRATTLVFSHNIETSIKSAQDVSESLATDVVIDGTAAVTLSLLDEGTRQDLIHQFSGIITTDHAYRDAISSEELLRRRPTLWIDWDEAENRIAKKTITDAAAERLYRQSVVALEILSNCDRQGWYELKHYADFDPETAWLSALDYAVDANHPFWCDDQCLRALAADKGVPTFGTVDLLRELDRLGRLSTAETKASEAVLIANYHVDLGFDTDVMLLAAQLDGWAPFGTAASLTRAAAWDDPRQVLAFLLRAVRENAKSSPHHVQEWVALVSSGAAKLTGDDSSQAAHNVRLIIDALVQQKWMQPDLFPFIIRGARQSLPLGQTFESELQSILSGVHGRLRERMPAAVASANLLSLVTYLDPDDQALAARIILGESL